jgi:hypothetical protein
MQIGEWYTDAYGGRQKKYYVVIHVGQTELALTIFLYDRKTVSIHEMQEYVTLDRAFFDQKIASGEIVPAPEGERTLIAPKISPMGQTSLKIKRQ